jgi:hypothetical protein
MAELITLPGPPTILNEGRRACYIEPACLVEVMFDQLACLLDHASASCSPECPHCARVEKVKNLLLVPFEVPTEPLVGGVADVDGHYGSFRDRHIDLHISLRTANLTILQRVAIWSLTGWRSTTWR